MCMHVHFDMHVRTHVCTHEEYDNGQVSNQLVVTCIIRPITCITRPVTYRASSYNMYSTEIQNGEASCLIQLPIARV